MSSDLFEILWKEDGWKDELPVDWFRMIGKFDTHHKVRKGTQAPKAYCTVSVNTKSADLDYGGKNASKNDRWYLGTMRLRFEDVSRQVVSKVEWKDEGDFRFEECNPSIANPNPVAADIEDIKKQAGIDKTTKKQLIDARLGQGNFRRGLEARWHNSCAVTGIELREVLRASHIQPWRDSKNDERLDPENGLLLRADLDALFDKYLISFEESGKILLSDRVKRAAVLNSKTSYHLRDKLKKSEKAFLKKHREKFLSIASK
jgi:hypothetical protein